MSVGAPSGSGRRVVVGAGNRFRRDDGFGLEAIERLRDRVPDGVELLTLEGEPTVLLELFAGSELVLLIDAIATGARPGAIHRFDATRAPVPDAVFGSSTHAFGLGETIELARTLGRLSGQVVVYGVVGVDFGAGTALSPAVEAALESAAAQILEDLKVPHFGRDHPERNSRCMNTR